MKKIYGLSLLVLLCATLFLVFFSLLKKQPESSLPRIKEPDAPAITTKDALQETLVLFQEKKPDPSVPVEFLYPLKNIDGSPVSFAQFSQALPLSLPKDIQELIDPNDYSLFRCNTKEGSSYGMQIIIAQGLPNYLGDPYLDMKKYLQEHNKEYIDILWNVLYPEKQKMPVSISKQYEDAYLYLPLSDITYNRAVFESITKEKLSLYYGLIENYILFTTSEDCLKKVSVQLFDLVP